MRVTIMKAYPLLSINAFFMADSVPLRVVYLGKLRGAADPEKPVALQIDLPSNMAFSTICIRPQWLHHSLPA